jgi:hypothetical protein
MVPVCLGVCVCMCAHAYVRVDACMHACMHTCEYACMHARTRVSMHAYMHACQSTYKHVNVCVCVCVFSPSRAIIVNMSYVGLLSWCALIPRNRKYLASRAVIHIVTMVFATAHFNSHGPTVPDRRTDGQRD